MVNLQRFTIGIPYTTQFQHMRCVSHFLTIVQHAPCAQTATMHSMKYYFAKAKYYFAKAKYYFAKYYFAKAKYYFAKYYFAKAR